MGRRRHHSADQVDGGGHVAVGRPVGVVGGGDVRDGDEALERRDDVVGPEAVDVGDGVVDAHAGEP